MVGLGTGTFSTRGPQTEEEILDAQRSGTTFGSAGPVRDPRLTKNEQGPRTIEQIQEDASAVFFGMGREIAKIVKEPNGPLMTREGSALRQQFDNAANTYARTLVAGGMDEESATRTVGIKKRLIEAKIPPILPQKGTLKPGEVPTRRDPISGDVTPAGAAAPFDRTPGTPTRPPPLDPCSRAGGAPARMPPAPSSGAASTPGSWRLACRRGRFLELQPTGLQAVMLQERARGLQRTLEQRDPHDRVVLLVKEHLPGGDLRERLGCLLDRVQQRDGFVRLVHGL